MKFATRSALCLAASVALAPFAAAGPPFAIDWYTIDGGGGTSSGGPFVLSGTIGQHDAAPPATGGVFQLSSGFWPGVVGQAGGCNAADLAEPFGTLNFSDVLEYLTAFAASDPVADLAPPFGTFNFSDVLAYLTAFGEGCP